MNQVITLSLIVPCYNESQRLRFDEFTQFISSNPDTLMCFVDDGSTDGTLSIINQIHNAYPDNVLTLSLAKNSGKSEAVRRGICHVIEVISSEFIGYIDADLATPLEEAVRLARIAKNQNLDFILASRVAVFGSLIRRNALRHYAGRIAATFISITLNLVIYDTQCGLKIFSQDLARETFSKQFISKWLFDVEIIARIKLKFGISHLSEYMKEIPITSWTEKGNSKISFSDVLKFPFELLAIGREYSTPGLQISTPGNIYNEPSSTKTLTSHLPVK